jgi:hypothetical protein
MLNFDNNVNETIDIAETAINILKTSSLTNITERDIYDSSPELQLELLKSTGACLLVQSIFKIDWKVAQELLTNIILNN